MPQIQNFDRELWRGMDEGNGTYYADSIHLTKGDGIAINVGGHTIVMPLRDWHAMAAGVNRPEHANCAPLDYEGPRCSGCEVCKALVKIAEAEARESGERAAKDGAYRERNQLVALLASVFPAGIKRTEIEGWSPEWHGCVYIDLPNGQASWHYHDSEAHLFAHLPPYAGEYDGHTTEEKYARIGQLALMRNAST